MTGKVKNNDTNMSFKLPKELYVAIAKRAKEGERSVSAEARRLIRVKLEEDKRCG